MKNKGLQLTLIIILGVIIVGVIALLIIGAVGSGKTSEKIELEATQEKNVTKVNDYALGDYFSNGSQETKAEPNQAQQNNVPVSNGDYIIPTSASKVLTDADLSGLNAQQLTYARNEIYARYGRPFQSNELKQYFQSKSWYHENPAYNDTQVSKQEEANAEFIAGYQARTNQEYNPQ